LPAAQWTPQIEVATKEPRATVLIPAQRNRYLAEIAEGGRAINADIERQVAAANRAQSYWNALKALDDPKLPSALALYDHADLAAGTHTDASLLKLRTQYHDALKAMSTEAVELLRTWPARREAVTKPRYTYEVRGKAVEGDNYVESLSHQHIPKIAAPVTENWGEQLRFLMRENLPGAYPFTAGVYPYRRQGEDPTRMFAGEGTPERTNRRFHYLSAGQKPRASQPRSTPSRSTAKIRTCARTSTARSATPACRSPRSTT
jgi:methylmalonyl-CoA mutase